MGIRIAVGARAGQVAWLILRQGLRLAVPGIRLGVPLALAVGRLLDSFLLGGRVADPVALAAVAGALLAATATASWMPARRAARVDPVRSLRVD
jgi:ABC-type antimicrobial peptide transport system permease subunit